MTIHIEATKQHFSLVVLLYKVVSTFEFMDKNKKVMSLTNFPAVLFIMLYEVVLIYECDYNE